MREVQIRRGNEKTFIFQKKNVSYGLILQSAQFSDLSNDCSAPNDIQITELAVNMCIIDREMSFQNVRTDVRSHSEPPSSNYSQSSHPGILSSVNELTTKKSISCMRNHFMRIPKNHVTGLIRVHRQLVVIEPVIQFS
jgi:hypothetical protein